MKLLNWLDNYFSKDEKEKIEQLKLEIEELNAQISFLQAKEEANIQLIQDKKTELEDLKTIYSMVLNDLEYCESQLPKIDELEEYWNNKRPKVDLRYPARPAFGSSDRISVDPRIFFNEYYSVPKVFGDTDDDIAMSALKYVINNVTYTSDTNAFKEPEVWLFPFETKDLKKGDCEDGAILLANIMLRSGIPYWRIRLNAGDVQGGGHCWVTYLRESDNKWYIMDWCYWQHESLKWKKWDDAEKYFKIWFSWNTKYIFKDDELDRE